MSEMDSGMDAGTNGQEAGMDDLLRRSMAAPIPRLSADFDGRVMREVRRRSQPPSRYGGMLLAGYGAVSVATCVLVMRGQGLGWGMIATMTLGPLVLVEAGRRLRGKRWGVAAG